MPAPGAGAFLLRCSCSCCLEGAQAAAWAAAHFGSGPGRRALGRWVGPQPVRPRRPWLAACSSSSWQRRSASDAVKGVAMSAR
eukprot:9710034-Lingulodinium_polyedra.AAC.1